jgi:hypothetical protein
MKKLNIKGFSHLEVLLTILVVVAVAGIGYFGYQRFQASNDAKAAAGSYTFIRNKNQMGGGKGIGGDRNLGIGPVTTIASASEMRSSKVVCTHYKVIGNHNAYQGAAIMYLTIKGEGKVRATTSKRITAKYGQSGSLCVNNKYTGNAGITVHLSWRDSIVVNTIYGKR